MDTATGRTRGYSKMQMLIGRKGIAQETGIIAFFLGLVGVGVVLGIGVYVIQTVQYSLTENGSAYNATGNFVTMFVNFTSQLSTVGTIGGILVLVVLMALVGIGGYSYGKNKGMF